MIARLGRELRLIPSLYRTMGPGWLAFRTAYALKLRSGHFRRRLPVTAWEDQPLAGCLSDGALAEPSSYLAYRRAAAPAFFFRPDDRRSFAGQFARWDGDEPAVLNAANEIVDGRLRLFGHLPIDLGASGIWGSSAFDAGSPPADQHWSTLDEFAAGDIKCLWESSRFGFTFPLVRAYWRTGDETYARRFWELVEVWRDANPPQRGPNWKCGQETSLRVMAWCFGLYGFLDSPTTTAEQVARLAQMIGVSGTRVAANHAYAISQRNNHGISEGLGLWTIGLLFPEFRSAVAWRERGGRTLEQAAADLVYDDGGFAQHSTNYQRLMLHAYLWCLRLGDLHGQSLSDTVRARVLRAAELLYQMQDAESGRVPNVGHNDGALILPLNSCSRGDYRPVIQATRVLVRDTRTFEPGPWDEDLLWLFGPEALERPLDPPPRSDVAAEASGFYTLRPPHGDGFAFIRCGQYRHRPAHADALHVDVWWRGLNLALDPGTFSYNDPTGWDRALPRTDCHNAVTVDGKSQMEQVGRFLWLPWLRGGRRASTRSSGGRLAYWEGWHDGYRRLSSPVDCRRGVLRVGDEHWLVLDELRSSDAHEYRLHWLLADLPYSVAELRHHGDGVAWPGHWSVRLDTDHGPYVVGVGSLDVPGRFDVVRADAADLHGWRAPTYRALEPALSISLRCAASYSHFWSLFGPPLDRLAFDGDTVRLETSAWIAEIELSRSIDSPLVTRGRWLERNRVTDHLDVIGAVR